MNIMNSEAQAIQMSAPDGSFSGSVLLGSFTRHWCPKDYLNEFYSSTELDPDEVEAMKFQVDFCKKLRGYPVALEFGSGPTAHRAITIAPYVAEIHIADFLQENLAELQRWVFKKESQHNWDAYVSYVLHCEGIQNPTVQQI